MDIVKKEEIRDRLMDYYQTGGGVVYNLGLKKEVVRIGQDYREVVRQNSY